MLAQMLMRLACHYYRPDFPESASLALVEDMVADLSAYALGDVEIAIQRYRSNAENRFFARSGDLIALIPKPEAPPTARARFEFGDFRPLDWEYQRKRFWKSHWQADDLRQARDPMRFVRYQRWLARVKAGLVAGKEPYEY